MKAGAALFAVWVMTGCGYRFSAPGGPLPRGIRAVHAPVMLNLTAEPGAETFFTQSLREQLMRSGVLGDGNSEARIEGAVLAVSSAPMAVSAAGRPTWRLSARAELKLLQHGEVVAHSQVGGEEDVLPGSGSADQIVAGTEASRQAALRRLADTLMREAYERLCTGWP